MKPASSDASAVHRRSAGRHRKSRLPSRRTLSVVTGAAGLVVAVTTGAVPMPLVSPGDGQESGAPVEPVTLLRGSPSGAQDETGGRDGADPGTAAGQAGSPAPTAQPTASAQASTPTAAPGRSRAPSSPSPKPSRPTPGGGGPLPAVPLPLPPTMSSSPIFPGLPSLPLPIPSLPLP